MQLLEILQNYAYLLTALAAVLAAVVLVLLVRTEGRRRLTEDRSRQLAETIERLNIQQAEMEGRLRQLGETQSAGQNFLGERLQVQERVLGDKLETHLADLTRRMGEGLTEQTLRTQTSLGQLAERLAVIDAAQRNIADLSTQMVGLQDILSNKQTRGAFGEIQLNDLVATILPPSAYQFQATLPDGKRVDCLLNLPNPPGDIGIDAKFPLESYMKFRAAETEDDRVRAARAFGADVLRHVKDIADKYIIPGVTAESALMFLPSEAVYAELHANYQSVVEESYRRRVWIVSPTTLMATLNTVRAVLKDVRMREQAGVIQAEVETLIRDMARLDDRVAKLQRHFEQATDDVRQIRISTEKVIKRGDRIRDVELGELPANGDNGDGDDDDQP